LDSSSFVRLRLIDMTKMKDDEVAEIGKALGDPNRLAIYTQIAQHEELFCGEMHAKHTISLATLSHHLKVLTELGLITSRKEGLNVYYRSIPEKLTAYLQYLASVAGHHSRK
jgi:ArsR family transcriptional regulator, arsenate/arsenite/antimonite-responsive transcriptional repressor